MHTLQRDMTVLPLFFFNTSCPALYTAATPTPLVPFLWQIYTSVFFFWALFSHLFLFLHLITNISSFIFGGSWYYSQRMKRFLWFILPYPARQCCPCFPLLFLFFFFFFFLWCWPTLLHGLSVLMDPTWLLAHTGTHTTKQHRKKSTHGTTTLAIFFAGEGDGGLFTLI